MTNTTVQLFNDLESYKSFNPYDDIKMYHSFSTAQYEFSVYYRYNDFNNVISNLKAYSSTKTLEYSLSMNNTEASVLRSFNNSVNNKSSISEDSYPYPIAVRYADHERGIYLIERPPFQIPLDYSIKKGPYRKEISFLKDKKIWIPWTLSLVSVGSSIQDYQQKLYVTEGPISSIDDVGVVPFFPNIFSDGRICFGESLYHVSQRIDAGEMSYNFSEVFNYLFNDFFNSWNPDISYRTTYAFNIIEKMGCFQKIAKSGVKRHPKNYDSLRHWNSSSAKFWFFFLYCYSFLDYEEAIHFYREYKKMLSVHDQKHATASVSTIISDVSRLNDSNYANNTYHRNNPNQVIWSNFWKLPFPNIVDTRVKVNIVNIPDRVLLTKNEISNPKLLAFIYYHFFKKLKLAFEQYNLNKADSDTSNSLFKEIFQRFDLDHHLSFNPDYLKDNDFSDYLNNYLISQDGELNLTLDYRFINGEIK